MKNKKMFFTVLLTIMLVPLFGQDIENYLIGSWYANPDRVGYPTMTFYAMSEPISWETKIIIDDRGFWQNVYCDVPVCKKGTWKSHSAGDYIFTLTTNDNTMREAVAVRRIDRDTVDLSSANWSTRSIRLYRY